MPTSRRRWPNGTKSRRSTSSWTKRLKLKSSKLDCRRPAGLCEVDAATRLHLFSRAQRERRQINADMLAGLAAQTPTQDALARLLDHIFDAQRIAHVQMLAEGLCNFNYRVELNDGSQPCVVRIYGRAPEACQKEAALLQLLRAHVPVPEVLHVHARGCGDIGPFIVM